MVMYRKPKVKSTKKVKKSLKASKTVKNIVKREFSKMIKVKDKRFSVANIGVNVSTGLPLASSALPFYNNAAFAIGNGCWIISPSPSSQAIAQGTGQGDRISNSIRIKKSTINMYLWQMGYDATYNPTPQPVNVIMIIYKIKGQGNTASASLSGLFQNGNTQSSPSNQLLDLCLPFNKDLYTVYYKKVIKVGFASNAGTGIDNAEQRFDSNDYMSCPHVKVDITKYLDTVYKYNDASTTPTNDFVYLAMWPVYNNNTFELATSNIYPYGATIDFYTQYTDVVD